jgi:hypothetical protein
VQNDKIAGLEVKRDAVNVGRGQWGTPVPVDPGKHVITASAPGKKGWEETIDATGAGKTFSVTVPDLQDAPVEKKTESVTPPPPAAVVVAEPPPPSSTQKTIGIVLMGAGVVGLGVGGFFGLQAMSKGSDSDRCPDPNNCDAETVKLRDDARSAGDISTIAFIAGGALAVGGAVLFFTAPRTKVQAAPAGLGVVVRATF